jgi:phage regulator Rha-like protein
MYFHYNNREIALRKEAEAQQGKIESVYDTMWKTLKQEAGVTDQYRKTFEEIYPKLIAGRYSQDGGELMKFIQESNPEFDTRLYDKLMQSIEAQRAYFASSQQRMLDIIRERETLLEQMPSCWFISNKSKIEYEVISSTASKDTMVSRREDDVELFK